MRDWVFANTCSPRLKSSSGTRVSYTTGLGTSILVLPPEPIVLLKTHFYTDSIRHKLVKMDGTEKSNRDKNKEQNELGVGNRTAHGTKYPFLQEFSELIHSLSIAEIEALLTQVQKRMATHLWEAENYGGSIDKAKKRLEDLYGTQWFKVTSFKSTLLR